MNEDTGTNREIQRVSVYEEFILWFAMPPAEQARLGIETQTQFCDYYKIGHNTPTAWKNRRDFKIRVKELRQKWGFEKTGGVIQGIYRSAVKGNPTSQRLWLEYVEGFNPKKEPPKAPEIVITVQDIRFLIEGMPEPERGQCYVHLREILDIASALRHSGRLEDGVPPYDDDDQPADGGAADFYKFMHPAKPKASPVPAVLRNTTCANSDWIARGSAGDFDVH